MQWQYYYENADNFSELYYSGIDRGDIIELSVNFDDNAQGIYVPTYVIEGDPERGRIYGLPPGWAVDEILRTKVETYELDDYFDYFNPGSESALNTSMISSKENVGLEGWEDKNPDDLSDEMQLELLDMQAKLKKTIIFITHDVNEAFKLGDRIAVMRDGRIAQIRRCRTMTFPVSL